MPVKKDVCSTGIEELDMKMSGGIPDRRYLFLSPDVVGQGKQHYACSSCSMGPGRVSVVSFSR